MIESLCVTFDTQNEFKMLQKCLLKNGCKWRDGAKAVKNFEIDGKSYIAIRYNIMKWSPVF